MSDLKLQFDRLSMMAGLVNEDCRYKIVEGIPLNEKTDYTQYDPADFLGQEPPSNEQPNGYQFVDYHGYDHKGGQGGHPTDLDQEVVDEARLRAKIKSLLKESPWGGLTRKSPKSVNMGGVGVGFEGWSANEEMIPGASGYEFMTLDCGCGDEETCEFCSEKSYDSYDDGQGRYGHGSSKPSRGDASRYQGGYIKGPGF